MNRRSEERRHSGWVEDGYLTINAVSNSNKDEKDKDGKYIRKERYSGSCTRTFYVGDSVKQDDIKAKFEDGTLKLTIPKETAKPAVEEKKYVSIEGWHVICAWWHTRTADP